MISIVTAYYNRKQLFIKTLQSIKQQNSKYLLEVIAVDDGSEENERLEDLVSKFPFLKVIRLEKKNKWYHNSCIPFNIGFKAAKGDKIIIQNPECFHYGNILDYTNQNLTQNNYLSFGCFSLDKNSTDNHLVSQTSEHVIALIKKNDHIVQNDGEAGWYNHSFHRPKSFHFCTAITKKNLGGLGGFDELYALGIGYDDNDILSRIKKKKLEIQFIDDEIVLHQNHYSTNSDSFQNRKYRANLIERNQRLYSRLLKKQYYEANIVSKFLNFKLKKLYIKIILNIIERV